MYNTTTINCITFNRVEIGDSHFSFNVLLTGEGKYIGHAVIYIMHPYPHRPLYWHPSSVILAT